jgi:hypothetical protein
VQDSCTTACCPARIWPTTPELSARQASGGPVGVRGTDARPFFPILPSKSPFTVIARTLSDHGIGVLELTPDFGGLPFEDISGMVHRPGHRSPAADPQVLICGFSC